MASAPELINNLDDYVQLLSKATRVVSTFSEHRAVLVLHTRSRLRCQMFGQTWCLMTRSVCSAAYRYWLVQEYRDRPADLGLVDHPLYLLSHRRSHIGIFVLGMNYYIYSFILFETIQLLFSYVNRPFFLYTRATFFAPNLQNITK